MSDGQNPTVVPSAPGPSAPIPANGDTTPGPSTSRGQKRPASDMTEPADKKSRTRTTHEVGIPGSHPSASGGILMHIANRFGTPIPLADTQFIRIDTSGMTGYFESLWDALVTAIYPDSSYDDTGVISAQNFSNVCRYLTKARIDQVYSSASGRRPPGRIAIPRDYEIPKALADVVNGIGPVLVNGGAFTVIPEPEAAPADPSTGLPNLVPYAVLTSFSRLVKAASCRGLIRTSYLSSAIDGTAWWLLTARKASNISTVALNDNQVTTAGVFKEWTPSDGVLCSIVQRGNDGLIPDLLPQLTWVFDTIPGVVGLRRTFNLDA